MYGKDDSMQPTLLPGAIVHIQVLFVAHLIPA